MVFNSAIFLICFLPLFFLCYYLLPARLRNAFLLVGSLGFYAWGDPGNILLLLAASAATYGFGRAMAPSAPKVRRRAVMWIGGTVLLALLFVFKYLPFCASVFGLSVKALPLPLGLPFFTFQALSYLLDVYHGRIEPERRVVPFALYLCMFPRVLQGPLMRYGALQPQLEARSLRVADVSDGCFRFTIGLSKKLLLANALGPMVDAVWQTQIGDVSVVTAWLALLAYALQIYFDFSGYTDMALGLGRMMGFTFAENFNYPYLARSVSDFWRRWHITLGQWFRDYVYFPLGGSRVNRVRLVRNLLIVWALTGFWHGADWNFLLWGLYFGVLLCIEKLLGLEKRRIPAVLRHGFCLLVILFGWVLFRSPSASHAFAYFGRLFHGTLLDGDARLYLHDQLPLLLVGIVGCTPLPRMLAERLSRRLPRPVLQCVAMVVLLALCLVALANSTYSAFLYLRF